MEGNSIFSSSTNSSTSSPTNTNFPFSLNQSSSTLHHHHGHHDHHGSLMMMMMGDHHDHQQVQILQPPLINSVHEPNHLMMNTYHDDDHHHHDHGNDNDDHQNKSIFIDNNNNNKDNDSNNKLIKKGSTVGKKGKKHRYAFQTRSQVDILDDGYRWRKYGQKAVKNSKFPRSYYRCTYQGCNVKKQVQRLSNDEGVVVTTYEGSHSHSIERSTDNFEHILSQMQIYTS